MKNGFLYQIANTVINSLKYLNLVELFKLIALRLNPNKSNNEERILFSRNSVDIFIVIKWVFVIILWVSKIDNFICNIIVWYLIFTNIYTYFYYHSWSAKILSDVTFDIDRIKRRFLHLMLAVFYSLFSFAYLINIPYRSEFSWNNHNFSALNSFWYSVSNSLTSNYAEISPKTDLGNIISMIELMISFLFITIIISNSIPQINTKNKIN